MISGLGALTATAPVKRLTTLRQYCRVVARYELVPLALAAPFFVFPNRWTGLAATLVGVTWLCRWVARGALSVRTPLDRPIAALLLMTAVAMYASVDLSASWPKFWGIFLGVALYYGVVNGTSDERVVERFANVLLALGIPVTLASLLVTDWQIHHYFDLSFVTSRLPSLPSLARLLPSGGVPLWAGHVGAWVRPDCCDPALLNPNEVGAAMGLLLPLATSIALFGRGRGTRVLAVVAASVFGLALIISQALTALAGVLVGTLLLLAWRYRWLVFVLPVGAAISVLVGWRYVLALLNPVNLIGWGVLERAAIWLWALKALRNEPLTGVGLNSFDYTLVGLYPMSLFYDVYHAHNQFLQVSLDLGIPGLLAFLWLLVAFGVSLRGALRRAAAPTSRAIAVGVGAGLVSHLIFGTLDALSLGAKPGVVFWAMLGLVSALNRPPTGLNPTGRSANLTIARSAALVAAGVIVTTLVSPGVQGLLYLNLGTLQAHQALAEVRSGATIPKDAMLTARQNLERAGSMGQSTVHAYGLIGSLDGWLGDCSGTVEYMRMNVRAGGDQPVGTAILASDRWGPTGAASVAAAWLRTKLGLPRTAETQLSSYHFMLDKTISRWGPVSGWWEPYLQAAIVANEELYQPDQAVLYLQQGQERATFPAPLGCYSIQAGGNP